MDNKEDRIKKLNLYLDKFNGLYSSHNKNIIWDTINYIQNLLEFSFRIQKYENMPSFYLGEEESEEDTNKSKQYKKPLIFLKLLKRCYAPVSDTSRKLFTNSEVLLASFPVMTTKVVKEIKHEDGTIEKYPYHTGLFYSDNEFILTLKTKTLKEQYEIINILERTFNIYAKKFYENMILASGIVKLESKELKDKDDLKTINIYFQMRLKEIVDIDDTFLLKAFTIFKGKEDIFEIDGSEGNFEPIKNIEYFPNKKTLKKQITRDENEQFVSIYK